jgi:hypothetical protein
MRRDVAVMAIIVVIAVLSFIMGMELGTIRMAQQVGAQGYKLVAANTYCYYVPFYKDQWETAPIPNVSGDRLNITTPISGAKLSD